MLSSDSWTPCFNASLFALGQDLLPDVALPSIMCRPEGFRVQGRVSSCAGLTDARSEWFGGSRRDAGHRKTAGEYEAHLRKRFPSIPNEWFANIAQQLEVCPAVTNSKP